MKLLFDQNLAPRLVARLADIFPASEHVRDVGLAAGDDQAVWEYARKGRTGPVRGMPTTMFEHSAIPRFRMASAP